MTQWYPRLCVYSDFQGWQNNQFTGRGEFALTFGNFNVKMTVPADQRHRWFISAVLFAAMLCGALSWHLVEKPCMRLVRSSSRSLGADFKDEESIPAIAPGGVRGNVG